MNFNFPMTVYWREVSFIINRRPIEVAFFTQINKFFVLYCRLADGSSFAEKKHNCLLNDKSSWKMLFQLKELLF
jgi:hypothetical protein